MFCCVPLSPHPSQVAILLLYLSFCRVVFIWGEKAKEEFMAYWWGEAEEKVEIKYSGAGNLRRKASSKRSDVCPMLADQSGSRTSSRFVFSLFFFSSPSYILFSLCVKQKLLVHDWGQPQVFWLINGDVRSKRGQVSFQKKFEMVSVCNLHEQLFAWGPLH